MLATQSETVGYSYTEKSPEHSSKPFNDRTTPPAPNNDKFTTQGSKPNNSQTISKQPEAKLSIANKSIPGTQILGNTTTEKLSGKLEKISS
jgi:hypothetical protein